MTDSPVIVTIRLGLGSWRAWAGLCGKAVPNWIFLFSYFEFSMNKWLYEMLSLRLTDPEIIKNVLVLGSAPSAPKCQSFLSKDVTVVALNNAHRAVSNVDISLYADDFPAELRHAGVVKIGRSSPHYLPAVADCGGMIYCGATIAFAALYWAMRVYPSSQISVYACDMIYEGGDTHFYGNGSADPLRKNISLQSLEAKSLRLFYFGLERGVLLLNASGEHRTRLMFPRVMSGLSIRNIYYHLVLDVIQDRWDGMRSKAKEAISLERTGPIDSGRLDYWYCSGDPSAWDYVRRVDEKWLALADDVLAISQGLNDVISGGVG